MTKYKYKIHILLKDKKIPASQRKVKIRYSKLEDQTSLVINLISEFGTPKHFLCNDNVIVLNGRKALISIVEMSTSLGV